MKPISYYLLKNELNRHLNVYWYIPSLDKGLMNDPFAVRTLAARTTPSELVWTSCTQPNSHCNGAKPCCFMSTNWSGFNCMPLLTFHLVRSCNEWRYSRLHPRQKCCRSCSTLCQRVSRFSLVSCKSWQGRLFSAVPIRKCPGLRYVKSFGSALSCMSGREFKIASISQSTVVIFSKVKWALPMIRAMWYLTDFTAASHKPPKWGALGGMKHQSRAREGIVVCVLVFGCRL